MAVIIYVNITDKGVYSVQPDLTGKVLIGITIPSGIPVPMLVNQITAFMASVNQDPMPVVLKVTIEDPVP